MRKRLLMILVVATVLVGCGNQQDTNNTEQPTSAESIATTESAFTSTDEPSTPEATQEPHSHNYAEEITTEATCEADGLKTFTCECGDTYTEAIPATGHVYENYVSNNDATYTADGTETASVYVRKILCKC